MPHKELLQYDYPVYCRHHASIAGISTMSGAALAQATAWYQHCLSGHEACNDSLASTQRMPSRLLRINEDQWYVRLIISKEEVAKDSHYSTLSHCWGNSDILKLTTSSLDKLKAGIPLKILPKTFIEAIYVARKMSIPYLWIDSLCIIQDSVADWQAESALMEDVYGNSSLNIMATASKDSHEGLSRVQNPILDPCLTVQSKWVDATNDLFYLTDTAFWNRTMGTAPLLRRGWVLQERVMSPRSLHFCENELLWECREMNACQSYPKGLPRICESTKSKFKLKEISYDEIIRTPSKGQGLDEVKKRLAYDRWNRWISFYVHTNLTNHSDKLVACSALAKCTRAVVDDVYVAGLWRTKFVEELLWSVQEGSRPREYRAPSWSWASVDGHIYFSSIIKRNIIYHIEIDSVEVTPASHIDDTGSILDGYFRARGLLIRHTIVKDKILGYKLLGNDVRIDWNADVHTLLKKVEIPVIVLPILTHEPAGEPSPNWHASALLLENRKGSPNGFYTRIGVMEKKAMFLKDRKDWGVGKSVVAKLVFLRKRGSSVIKLYNSLRNGKGVDLWPECDKSLYLADSPGSFVVY
ncbi:68973a4e-32bc-455a-ac57-2f3cfafeab69-CDS [Sclerotinia trifoliorum]|uniref:68973a4e-32bc-455a-ac57-2f3cfafeab69-CDS n=1 Tax=Sclerotinia trifoliorum TaxID=28548 RepID=A0A8H2W4R6_9HELO|nr:68973a4e-32bc-455a-ac57-2f3cfafeab69-CDS [Sclerotinia trifoliorum]